MWQPEEDRPSEHEPGIPFTCLSGEPYRSDHHRIGREQGACRDPGGADVGVVARSGGRTQRTTAVFAIMELLNSSQAAKLLAPVPQLDLPCNAPGPNNIQADLPAVDTTVTTRIDPVAYEYIDAVMESRRLANWGIRKGKILGSRLPDWNLKYNMFVTFCGWEKKHP